MSREFFVPLSLQAFETSGAEKYLQMINVRLIIVGWFYWCRCWLIESEQIRRTAISSNDPIINYDETRKKSTLKIEEKTKNLKTGDNYKRIWKLRFAGISRQLCIGTSHLPTLLTIKLCPAIWLTVKKGTFFNCKLVGNSIHHSILFLFSPRSSQGDHCNALYCNRLRMNCFFSLQVQRGRKSRMQLETMDGNNLPRSVSISNKKIINHKINNKNWTLFNHTIPIAKIKNKVYQKTDSFPIFHFEYFSKINNKGKPKLFQSDKIPIAKIKNIITQKSKYNFGLMINYPPRGTRVRISTKNQKNWPIFKVPFLPLPFYLAHDEFASSS